MEKSKITYEEYQNLLSCGFSSLESVDGLEALKALNGEIQVGSGKTNKIKTQKPYVSSWALWNYVEEAEGKLCKEDSSWSAYVKTLLGSNATITKENFAKLQPKLKRNVAFITLNASEPAEDVHFEPNEFFHLCPATNKSATNINTRFFRSMVYNKIYGASCFQGAYITDLFKIKSNLEPMLPTITVLKDSNVINGDATIVNDEAVIYTNPNFKLLYNELNILRGNESILLIPMGKSCKEYIGKFIQWLETTHSDTVQNFIVPKVGGIVANVDHYGYARNHPNSKEKEKNAPKIKQLSDQFAIFVKYYEQMQKN